MTSTADLTDSPCSYDVDRRRRDDHPEPPRRDEQPRRRDQGALRDAVPQAAEDAAVRCVVLTGTGRAFCVGQDLKEHIEPARSGDIDALFRTVDRALQPDRHGAGRRCRSR